MNLYRLFSSITGKTGLALGGGAALGAAHVGVLKAFDEKGVMPDCVSGTSIGAFVGAHIAFGTPVNKLIEIALELDWLDVTAFKLSKMGMLSNKRLGKHVLNYFGYVNIQDANIPLRMVATDISSGEKVVLKEGPLHKAVMASTCLPGIFTPVEWEGRLLVDGGLSENVPVSPLREMGARQIIAVDLIANRSFKRPENIADVLINTFGIVQHKMLNEHLGDDSILWIKPPLSAYNMADTGKAVNLIQEGYEAAIKVLEQNR
jgi:NTE family protein